MRLSLLIVSSFALLAAACSGAPTPAQPAAPAESIATAAVTPPAPTKPPVEVVVATPKPAAPAAFQAIDAFLAGKRIDKSDPQWRLSMPLPPQQAFDPAYEYWWMLDTSHGPLRIRLHADTAPMHVTSCVMLNKAGYYDGLGFHRIIPGFMAQGGCPSGTGSGGPGYSFDGEFQGGCKHDRPGILSMAHRGPGTDGSQFFLTFAPTPHLDGKHTVWGELVGEDSFATLQKLAEVGSQSGRTDGAVTIQKAWVRADRR